VAEIISVLVEVDGNAGEGEVRLAAIAHAVAVNIVEESALDGRGDQTVFQALHLRAQGSTGAAASGANPLRSHAREPGERFHGEVSFGNEACGLIQSPWCAGQTPGR